MIVIQRVDVRLLVVGMYIVVQSKFLQAIAEKRLFSMNALRP